MARSISDAESIDPFETRLTWAWTNRRPRREGAWIGDLTMRIVSDDLRERGRFRWVQEIIERHVDDTFRGACRIESVCQGQVVIVVAGADLRYHMEKKWRSEITAALDEAGPFSGRWQVRFMAARQGD